MLLASFILFMTPGVRPFVQHYTSTTCTTALALIVSFFCLRHAANHAPRLAGLSFFLFTLVLALTCAVATTYFGTEMVYTVCSMNGFVFLIHTVYCIQTLRSLHFIPSAIFTVFLVLTQAWFLELFLMFINFDYLSHVLLSTATCVYVHWNIGYFSQILTCKETVLACVSVFISFPKLY
ncbi:hypothetical protein RB195_015937 [Necator americanus]|uniref:Uncharacterized protein n=1 Tax=Necator americanus TaxID=51031 RepID=A0ABR1E6T4_NECAM